MNINELLLKTAFACMSCDGEIAIEEVALLKQLSNDKQLFGDIDINVELEKLVQEINSKGKRFLIQYLDTLSKTTLTEEDEIHVANVAVQTIRADQKIEYSEIKVFKNIRSHLQHVSDETLLAKIDGMEEVYLAQDVKEDFFQSYDDYFDKIVFSLSQIPN